MAYRLFLSLHRGILGANDALIEHCVSLAHAAGLKVCLDMASYNIVEAERDFFAQLLQDVDIVFANEEEARAFTGKEAEEALTDLAEICPVAVVKVGSRGAMARQSDETATVPAGKVTIVKDTTAAGDYFAAGFLHAYAKGLPLQCCLESGTLLASHIVQVVGTSLPEFIWEDIRSCLNNASFVTTQTNTDTV